MFPPDGCVAETRCRELQKLCLIYALWQLAGNYGRSEIQESLPIAAHLAANWERLPTAQSSSGCRYGGGNQLTDRDRALDVSLCG